MLGSCVPASAASHQMLLLQELKDFFQEVHGPHDISFPEQLPVSALVGCVTVVDVLTVCFSLPSQVCSSRLLKHQSLFFVLTNTAMMG